MATRRRCSEVLTGVWIATAPMLAAAGGSVDAGRAIYASVCSSCHGELRLGISPMIAADAPGRIRNAINPQSTMKVLSFLTNQDIDDVASYIARPLSNDTDRLLDWAETEVIPDDLGRPTGPSEEWNGFRYRYYPRPRMFLGTRDGLVFRFGAGDAGPVLIGTMRQFLAELPAGR